MAYSESELCPYCDADLSVWGQASGNGRLICSKCRNVVEALWSPASADKSGVLPHQGQRPPMVNTNCNQAELAYQLINGKANANSVMQGLTGIAGFPLTVAADVAVIPAIYIPLWNDIRRVYGYDPVGATALSSILGKIMPEVLADLALDKVMGNIPVLGVYFNAICAKAMTWRLGCLFAFLSSRGDGVPAELVQQAMQLIRLSFPQRDMFRFETPDRGTFIKLVTSVGGISESDLKSRLNRALDLLGQ